MLLGKGTYSISIEDYKNGHWCFDRGSAVVQTTMRVLLIISAEYLVEFMTRLATITWAMLYS